MYIHYTVLSIFGLAEYHHRYWSIWELVTQKATKKPKNIVGKRRPENYTE